MNLEPESADMNIPNEFWHTPVDEEVDYVNVPPPASAAAIRRWEEVHEVRLPPTLVEALMIQDGGYVRGTDLDFEGLDTITTLDGEDWDHVEEGLGLSPGDRRKQFLIGDCGGLGVVLDYNVGPEPRILFLWHDLGGELRGIDDLVTFDQFLQDAWDRRNPPSDEQSPE